MDFDSAEYEEGEETLEQVKPDLRITINRNGTIRIVDWTPWLATNGPLYTLLDARGRAGVLIADLRILRDDEGNADELICDVLCGDSAEHRRHVCEWAAFVGYRRVWLEGEVLELEPTSMRQARTRCTGCGVRLVDDKRGFWGFVRRRGAFPSTCSLCGSDLLQWQPARQSREAVNDAAPEPQMRRTVCK
jgi:hypothetical protein